MLTLNDALKRLVELLDAGLEFPDAVIKVSKEYYISVDVLTEAYDSLTFE